MRIISCCIGLIVAACGGDDPADTPIPSTPLAGELNGMAWTAGGAKARMGSDEGDKAVSIYPDTDLTCDSFGDEPYVGAVFPWVEGTQTLGLESDAAVFIFFDATAHIVFDGRIELITAPTEVGATATLRIRAVFEDDDDDLFVEGEVPVMICE